jgi:hypothetical protein
MFKKWNRILAFLLSIALVTTTFGSDFASAKVYAEENEIVEESDDTEEPKEETTIADLNSAEVIPQDELGGENENGSGSSGDDGEGTTPVVASNEGNVEDTPTTVVPVSTTDEPEYELDEDGNPVLDENGNPKLKEKVAEEETEEEVVETEEEVDGIKIYYVVSDEDAGYVDNDGDVFAEGKEIAGSTAEAFDGYEFVNWTDEDGKSVSKKATFIPTASDLGLSEDAEGEESEDEVKEITFTANFVEEEGPSYTLEFKESKTVNGIKVSLWAAEGVIPDDAVLDVQPLSASEEQQVTDLIDEQTGDAVAVEKTISFDINIYAPSLKSEDNEDGKVQPKDDGTVQITFENVSEASDDDYSLDVYHVSDSISYATEIEGVKVNSEDETVAFGVEHFSTYSIVVKSKNVTKEFKFNAHCINPNTDLTTSNASLVVTSDKGEAVAKLADEIIITTPGNYAFSYAKIGYSKITEIKYNSSKKKLQYKREGKSSFDNFSNDTTVDFYFEKAGIFTFSAYNGNTKLTTTNTTFTVDTSEGVTVKELADQITITSSGAFAFSYAKIGNDKISNIKFDSDKKKLQYKKENANNWTDFPNNTTVNFYFDKAYSITAKCVDEDGNEISTDETFAVITEDDCYNIIMPSKTEITSADGSKYSYKGKYVYDTYYDNWGTILLYEVKDNNIRAWYGNGSGQYVWLTQTNNYSGDPNVYFVYESTANNFNVQITEISWNGYDYQYATIDDPIQYTVDDSFNTSVLKSPANFVDTDEYRYVYYGTQVYTGNDWKTAQDFEKRGTAVYAKYFSGYSSKEIKLKGDNIRHLYRILSGDHLDLGFKSETEFNRYKENGASVYAEVNGTEYKINPADQGSEGAFDTELKTWEYRLDASTYGRYFKYTDNIVFKVVYKGRTYKYEPTSGENKAASDACYNAHKDRNQTHYGFDYAFSFENQFFAEGNLIYHKNDGSKTLEVPDVQTAAGVNDFVFTVKDINNVGFDSGDIPGGVHKDGAKYAFIGWSEDTPKDTPDITLKDIQKGKTIKVAKNGRKELYAVWKCLSYDVVYLDGYNAEGKNLVAKYTLDYGVPTQKPSNPTQNLYTFVGWYVTGDPNKTIVEPTEITVTGPASYTAKWEREYPSGQLTIKAISYTKTYNGEALYAGYTVENKPADFDSRFAITGVTYKNKATGATSSALSITDAGTLNYEIATYKIVDKNNNNTDETAYFNPVLSKEGTLTVNPIKIEVSTGEQTWNYDGQEHRNYDIKYKGQTLDRDADNYVTITPIKGKDETIKLRTNASVKYPIKDVNKDNVLDTYVYAGGAKEKNYTIIPTLGKLSITLAEAAFVIKAADHSFTYNGSEQKWDVVDTISKPEGYDNFTIEASVTSGSFVKDFSSAASGAETVTVDNVVNRDTIRVYTTINGVKTDVTENFDVEKITSQKGTLTLNKRQIKIQSGSAEKEYDGTPLKAESVALAEGSEELAPGQKIEDLVTISNYASVIAVTPDAGVDNTYDHEENEETGLAKNYKITYGCGKLKITKRISAIKITARTDSKKYDGQAFTPGDLVNAEGKPYFYDLEGTLADGDELRVTTSGSITNVGSKTHKVETVKIYNGDVEVTSSYQNIEKVNGTLTITPRQITLTSATWEKEYDGTALTNETGLAKSANPLDPNKGVVITWPADQSFGFVEGEGIDSYSFDGSQTLVGSSGNTFTYKLKRGTTEQTENKAGNYIITKVEKTLTVIDRKDPYVVKVKANSNTVTYDGSEHGASGFMSNYEGRTFTVVKDKGLKFIENGENYYITEISASKTATDVNRASVDDEPGSYNVVVTGKAVVKDENGNDVTKQFDVQTSDGTLTINPRSLTFESATDSKQYDGKPLTNDTVTVTPATAEAGGFVDGQGVTFDVTGTVTYKSEGEVDNAYTYKPNDGTKLINYNITKNVGKLSITDRNNKIEINLTANSGEFTYDGVAHTVSGFKTTEFTFNDRTYYVSGLESTRTETDVNYDNDKKEVKSYPISVTGEVKVEVQDGNKLVEVTDQCDVKVTTKGTLLINQRNVTLTSASGEKEYDGTALTSAWLVEKNKATVDGKPVTEEVVVTSEKGFAKEEGATYTVTGSRTRVGSDPENNTFTYKLKKGTNPNNYNITTVYGTLKVTDRNQKYKITVTAKSDTFTYDGIEHTLSGFVAGEGTPFTQTDKGLEFYEGDVKYYVAGITATGKATNVTDPGIVEIKAEAEGGLGVFDSDDENVTDQFNVTTVNGKITIEPRKVFLKSSTWEKVYDGSALTNGVGLINAGKSAEEQPLGVEQYVPEGQDKSKLGFVLDQGATYHSFKGTVTVSGKEVDNVFDYTLKEGTDSNNYDISTTYGKLKVVSRGNDRYVVKLRANDGNEKYTGSEITVTGFKSSYDGKSFEVTDNGLKFIGENDVVYYIQGVRASGSGTDVKAGGYTVTAEKTDDFDVVNQDGVSLKDEFDVKLENGTLTITPRQITLTSASGTKEFDGKALTSEWLVDNNKATVNGKLVTKEVVVTSEDDFVDGQGVNCEVTGSQTLVGGEEHNNIFTYTLKFGTNKDNYVITPVYGTLTVTNRLEPYEVTVKANSDTFPYDGDEHTVSGFVTNEVVEERTFANTRKGLKFTENGVDYYITGISANKKATDVNRASVDDEPGSYNVEVTGTTVVKDENGNDVTGQFNVHTLGGTLKITPIKITLKAASGEKEYDGTPLDSQWLVDHEEIGKDEVVVQTGKFAKRDGFKTLTTEGSVLLPNQTAPNKVKYELNDATKATNYDIEEEPGSLHIKNRDAKYEITVYAASGEEKYDGSMKSVTGFEKVVYNETNFKPIDGVLKFTLNKKEFTVTGLTASGAEATDVNRVGGEVKVAQTNSISGTAVVTDEDGNPVTEQFEVGTKDGGLTITPREVTLVAGSAEKYFDGKPLKSATYFRKTGEGIDGFATTPEGIDEGKGITVKVKGSQTLVDSSDNEITDVIFDGKIAKEDNYKVTKEKGTLTVKQRPDDKKIKLIVTVDVDKTGKNYVEKMYNGEKQKVDVKVVITGDGTIEEITEEDVPTVIEIDEPVVQEETASERDTAKAILKKLLSIGTITAYAMEDDAEVEPVQEVSETVEIGGITFNVSGIKISGGEGTDFGKYPVTIDTSNLLVTLDKAPVTGNFEVEIVPVKKAEKAEVVEDAENIEEMEDIEEAYDDNVIGMLYITSRHAILTSETASKTYDGTALTRPEVAVGGDGFVDGEVIDIHATGSITDVGGPIENTISYTINPEIEKYYNDPELFGKNYSIETNTGTLTITAVPSRDDDDDDDDDTTTIPDAPIALAPAPTGAVLGAQRATGDGPAVLGARRAGTDDETNRMARVFAMVAAAAIAVTMMITGKKKDEEEEG